MLFNLLADNQKGADGTNWPSYILIGVIILAFIAFSIYQNRQRKKQQAKDQEQKSKLCAGTTVITIGGVMGTVVSVNHDENSFVLDSQGSLIKFDKRAIYQMELPKGADKKVEEKVEEAPAKEESK